MLDILTTFLLWSCFTNPVGKDIVTSTRVVACFYPLLRRVFLIFLNHFCLMQMHALSFCRNYRNTSEVSATRLGVGACAQSSAIIHETIMTKSLHTTHRTTITTSCNGSGMAINVGLDWYGCRPAAGLR